MGYLRYILILSTLGNKEDYDLFSDSRTKDLYLRINCSFMN